MTRILAIEDDPAILLGLADNLRRASYEVLTARDAETAYQLIHELEPDLILLDLMLPGMSGYELCQRLRGEGLATPILMLTARGEEADRVLGLDVGADDYITKPFSIRELLARIRATLRRPGSFRGIPDELRAGHIAIRFDRYEAHKGGKEVRLTRKEFGIIKALASRAGQPMTREELLNEVWGYDRFPTTRTVDNHIASIRSKLEDDPSAPTYLLTVHGVGYKWVMDESRS